MEVNERDERSEELQSGINFFSNLLKIKEDANIYIKRADLYHIKGEIEKAIDDLKRAIELDPKSDIAYYNLGVIYWEIGEKEKAKECFKKALEINPSLVRELMKQMNE